MKKIWWLLISIVVFFLLLPTCINTILFWKYEHGREKLELKKGFGGEFIGTWKGTFDTYQCGSDERHIYEFIFDSDTSGHVLYSFQGDKVFVGATSVYDWESVFPFDDSKTTHYKTNFYRNKDYLIIEPSENWWSDERSFLKVKLDGDELYIGCVDTVGLEPERWGIDFSSPDFKPELSDLIQMWWELEF